MVFIAVTVVWLIVGYVFTLWFVNCFLDNRRWSDTGKEPTPFGLLVLTVFGPVMAVIMVGLCAVEWLFSRDGLGSAIKRLYFMER